MTDSAFTPTLRQQVSVSFAYLAYIGEELAGNDPTRIAGQILNQNENHDARPETAAQRWSARLGNRLGTSILHV